MRQLSPDFMTALKTGFLAGLTQAVIADKDLDLQIRNNYLNIYYKGNSLLRLAELTPGQYRVELHEKFKAELLLPALLVDEQTTASFLGQLPYLKENIIKYGKSSLEIEYEQLIIRANNLEPRNNSEYFILDRQYATQAGRFDLTGFVWPRNKRRRGQEVPLCFMEIKFALNPDIQEVHQQLARYYEVIKADPQALADEAEAIFKQKLELGLFKQDPARLAALQTLEFSGDIDQFQFILILVDYNPYSSHFNLAQLKQLPFAQQVKIFHSGFAMWQQNLREITQL